MMYLYIFSFEEINKETEEKIENPEDITLEHLNAYTSELLRCRHVMLFYKERLALYEVRYIILFLCVLLQCLFFISIVVVFLSFVIVSQKNNGTVPDRIIQNIDFYSPA